VLTKRIAASGDENAQKVVNCVALRGENLKMGKDVRAVEREKCACGECEDLMRSDGATCGYCGCLRTRHSKKDARYSSKSVGGTSGVGTTVVSGNSEAIRKFSDKYIVPEKLVAEYVEHLAQIKMRKDKKKEETERERIEPGVQ